MTKQKRNLLVRVGGGVGTAVATVSAHAAVWDITPVTDAIGNGAVAATAIGIAMIGLAGLIGAIRMTRGAAR